MLGRGSQRVSDENIIAGNFTKLTSRSRNEEKEGKDVESPVEINGGNITDEKVTKDAVSLVSKERSRQAYNYKSGKVACKASWVVNWILLVVKAIAFYYSGSQSVCASLADSAVDLISQFVLSFAEHLKNTKSLSYPVGRDKMEGIGVLLCSAIMIVACIEIIQSSALTLYEGTHGLREQLEASVLAFVILGVGTVLKFFLWLFCRWANKSAKSDLLEALAEDHLNDCFSNVVAIIAACVASELKAAWWLDAAGGVGISAIIVWRWVLISYDQIKQLVGFIAPPELHDRVLKICNEMEISSSDTQIIAYNDGSKYIIEMVIKLPSSLSVQDSALLCKKLKTRISELEEIRRCYVEIDEKEVQRLSTSTQPQIPILVSAVIKFSYPKRKKQMKLI